MITSTLGADWHHELVSAWLAFAARPDCHNNLNLLGSTLDAGLRVCRPDESFGSLREHAEEIRQNAHILLLHGDGVFARRAKSRPQVGYLEGNRALLEATVCGDEAGVARQLLRSLYSAIHQCSRRLRRRLAWEKKHRLALTDVSDGALGIYLPKLEFHPAELSEGVRREFVLALLHEARASALFSRETLEIATLVYGELCRASEVARERNVSKAAISQRLQPVRKWLRKQHPELEMPLA